MQDQRRGQETGHSERAYSSVALASCRLYRCRPGGIPEKSRQDAGATEGIQKGGDRSFDRITG